jgi:hypothetical protein
VTTDCSFDPVVSILKIFMDRVSCLSQNVFDNTHKMSTLFIEW